MADSGTQYLPGGGQGAVKQWFGVYLGYIAVNADPLAQGRVRLRVPQVFGSTTSGWAAPSVPLVFIPQVGTPVTVMFIGGDPTKPTWFGNFALPDEAAGMVFSASQPTSPTLGEVWVNTTDGLMSEWNGAGWVAYNIGSSALGPDAVIAGNVGANHFGLNMITDAGFNDPAMNAIRTATPTSGTWTISAGQAASAETIHSAVMFLTPPNALSLNPGEQYYLSVQVTATGPTAAVGIGVENTASTMTVNQSATFTASGTQTISGVVTIPSGFGGTGYIRLFVTGSGTDTATVAFASPLCQSAVLNSPTIIGGTITVGGASEPQVHIFQGAGGAVIEFPLPGDSSWPSRSNIFGGVGGALGINGPIDTSAADQVRMALGSNGANLESVSPNSAGWNILYKDASGGQNLHVYGDYAGVSLPVVSQMSAVTPGTGTSPTNPATPAGWITQTFAFAGAGWGGSLSWILMPGNTVHIMGRINFPAASYPNPFTLIPASYNWFTTGYLPVNAVNINGTVNVTSTEAFTPVMFFLRPTGEMDVYGATPTAAGTWNINGVYRTDYPA